MVFKYDTYLNLFRTLDKPKMSVVNCRVKYIRPQYPNLEMWMAEDKNVYIGRGGVVFIDGARFPKKASPFANPFKVGRDGTHEDVVRKFKEYMWGRVNSDPELKEQLLALKGKNLGCWCKPEPCHGDILLEMIGEIEKQ